MFCIDSMNELPFPITKRLDKMNPNYISLKHLTVYLYFYLFGRVLNHYGAKEKKNSAF